MPVLLPIRRHSRPTLPSPLTATLTATDKCQTVTATSTYTVTPPQPLTLTAPTAKTVDACAIADQAPLTADFTQSTNSDPHGYGQVPNRYRYFYLYGDATATADADGTHS